MPPRHAALEVAPVDLGSPPAPHSPVVLPVMPAPLTWARFPTQVLHPGRAAARTAVAALLALLIPAGIICAWGGLQVDLPGPGALYVALAAVLLAGVAGMLTLLATTPAVDRWLTRYGLGAAPK